MDKANAQRVLDIAWQVGALLKGDFTLASGRKSTHYFDGKKVTLSAEGAYRVGKAVFDAMLETGADAIGGPTIGADPVAGAVSVISYLEKKPVVAFLVREERKEHGTQRIAEGYLRPGAKVVIFDDVITTGGSLRRAIQAAEEAGCKVVKVMTVVDRHEGGSDQLKSEGYAFEALIDLFPTGEVRVGGG